MLYGQCGFLSLPSITFTVPASQLYTITITADNFTSGGPLQDFTPTLINATGVASDSNGLTSGVLGSGGVVTTTAVITTVNNYTFDFGFFKTINASPSKDGAPLSATIGQTVTYVITIPQPAVNDSLLTVVVTDDVPTNLTGVIAAIEPLTTGGSVNVSGNQVVATWPVIPTATQYRLIITGVVANLPANQDGVIFTNTAELLHRDTDSITTTPPVTVSVAIPALVVDKSVIPPLAVPGGVITWVMAVRNVGSGPAFGVDISDTLPSTFFTYEPGSSQLNGVPIGDPAIAGLNLFWNLDQTVPGFGVFTLTFRTLISNLIPQGVYTNVASAVNGRDELGNPIPPDNSSRVPPDTDADDTDDATVLVTLLRVTKSVADTALTPNQVTTYTIRVDNPGGNPITLTVTDTLPSGFAYADNAQVNGSPDEPDDNTPPTLVWSTLPALNPGQSLTITFQVTAATELSGVYTNSVEVIGTDNGGNTVTDTNNVTTTLNTTPSIVITKTRVTPSPVVQGDPIVYNVTVQNLGNTTLLNVPLVDTYDPTYLQFNAATPAPDSTTPAGTLTWNDLTATFGDLAPGASVTIVATFTALYAAGGVTTLNAVQVTGVDTNTTTVTDTDSTTVSILSPRLDFDKRVSATGTISPGQRLDYTLCVTNSGNLTATNVVITDFILFNTTYISGSVIAPVPAVVEYQDNGGAFVGTEPLTTTGLRWTLAQLSPGAGLCVGFSVRVNMTLSDTISGMTVMASPLGWIVLTGDTTGLEIITRTTLTTPTVTLTPTPTTTPTLTPTPELTITPEITVTPEVTLTVTPTPVPTPVITSTPVVTATDTPIPTATPTLEATATLAPTETATPLPTETPTLLPTEASTPEPTFTPTLATETPTTTPTPTETATDTPTPMAEPSVEPAPTSEAVLPGWFVIAVGMVAFGGATHFREASALHLGQPAFQEPITPTTQPPVGTDTTTVEPTTEPETTTEPVPTPEVTPNETVTPTATITASEPPPIATLTSTVISTPTLPPTVEPTASPDVTGTPELTGTTPPPSETPTATLESTPTITPELTATETPTATPPVAPSEYPIVAFDTVIINVTNVATLTSDQTPPQTDVVTNPVIRVVDPLLTKVVNPREASPGDLVNFTLTVDNPSPPSNANATNLVLVDPLPLLVDLVAFTVSSTPSGRVGSVTVVTNTVPIVGHPLGITQAVATTITVNIPVLGPNERVILNLTTRVNNLASPPPQTIRNIAFLTFNEGQVPPARVSVDVPMPPRRDDDDDDNLPPPPVATPITPPPIIQPAPTLPAQYLPDTGLRETAAGDATVGGLLFLLVVIAMGTALRWLRIKS